MTDTRLADAQCHRVGDIRVTALSDGPLPIGLKNLLDLDEPEYKRILHAHFREPETYRSGLNAFLIEMPDRTVLVDAGGGGALGPETGRVARNLAATGTAPEAIERIYCTHMHGDHIGGLTDNAGAAIFPNAALVMHENERAYWSDEAHATDSSRATFAAYEGRIETFAGETEIAAGLTTVPLPGHTPGHSGLRITSDDEALLIWTDIVHLAPVQLAMPEIGVNFDVDPEMARATRSALLEQVAADRTLIAGSHIGFPGIGWIEPEGEGYRFVAVPYTHDWR